MKPIIALSSCWCSHRHQDGYVMLKEMAALGFDHVELSHGIRITLVPGILKAVDGQTGDLIFFGAGPYKTVSDFMGALRLVVGRDMKLVEDGWRPLWVVDFPMFEFDHAENRWVSLHHPFTAPSIDDVAELTANPGDALSRGYD
ncbi:MAG TPA: hypothetical protein PLG56_13335, partial [Lacunisphaera sp.]|nr:hypothetical protein [Lacunisphaera sp.]